MQRTRKERLILTKKIYPIEKVKEAIAAYNEFEIMVSQDDKKIIAEITYDESIYLPGEFANYLISLIR